LKLKLDYKSPRWSQEILDCSMPMTFDTYSVCSFDCLYCFSFFQKSHVLNGYEEKTVRAVNPDKIKALFSNILSGNHEALNQTDKQFIPYVTERKVMQWGALADEFDNFEKQFGITLELLRFFDAIDYPLSFSTKGTWWTKDSRYMELFAKHTHNWHVKLSIITSNEEKARKIERGVPSPKARFDAMKALTDLGLNVTLRLRPFIIGVSEDWKETIINGAEAGANSVTTEFFCMESRADARLKERYRKMSEVTNYNVHEFYMKNSKQQGYKRLSRGIKAPIIREMAKFSHSLGLRFHVSDAACRELNDAPNCCGVPPEWNSQYAHFGKAILIAKEKGEVRFSDIQEDVNRLFGFKWYKAANFNTSSNLKRALFANATMADYIRYNWNRPTAGTSPAKMYGFVLVPKGVDENGDVIYSYNPEAGGHRHGLSKESEGTSEGISAT